MRPKTFTLICLLSMAASLLKAQHQTFSNYTAADGLSDNTVLCALHDSYGFMWLGTHNGLNRFDGKQNTIYRNMVEDDTRFENNTITSLFEQGDDIWFGGSFGLYVYHRQTNTFSRFNKKTKYGVTISCSVNTIERGQNGLIWIATLGQGLFVYNPQTDELTQDSRHGAFLSDIVAMDNGPVYIASLSGVILVYGQDMSFLRQYAIPGYESDKNLISLTTLADKLYIGSEQGLYSLENGELRMENERLGVRALCGGADKLLIGTDKGLFTLTAKASSSTAVPLDPTYNLPKPEKALEGTSVKGILFDSDSGR